MNYRQFFLLSFFQFVRQKIQSSVQSALQKWSRFDWQQRFLLVFFLCIPWGGGWRLVSQELYGQDSQYTSFNFYFSDVVWIVFLTVAATKIGYFVVKKKNRSLGRFVTQWSWFYWWLIILSLGLLISIQWSLVVEVSYYQAVRFSQVVAIVFLWKTVVLSNNWWRFLEKVLLWGLLSQSFLAWLQFIFQKNFLTGFWRNLVGEPLLSNWQEGVSFIVFNGQKILRPYGTFAHPNLLAAYLLLTLVWWVGLVLKNRGVVRFWQAMVIITTVATIGLTLSRVVWSGLLIISIVTFISFYHIFLKHLKTFGVQVKSVVSLNLVSKTKQWSAGVKESKVALRILLWLFIIVAGVMASWLAWQRIMQLSSSGYAGWQERFELNLIGWQMILQHPHPVGWGQFVYWIRLYDPYGSFDNFVQPIHNVYWLVAVEAGWWVSLWLVGGLLKAQKQLSKFKSGDYWPWAVWLSWLLIIWLLWWDHYFWTLQPGLLLLSMVWGAAARLLQKR